MKIRLFSFFKRKSKKNKTRRRYRKRTTSKQQNRHNPAIEDIQSRIKTINLILFKHDQDITEHTHILENHIDTLQTLEQRIARQPISPLIPSMDRLNRPIQAPAAVSTTRPVTGLTDQTFDLSRFSPQEKRILSVFFQNKSMALSYVDLARSMGKSPNTIKNQMRQIIMKADLFDYTVDHENRKRYQLKDNLKIEKYLNITH